MTLCRLKCLWWYSVASLYSEMLNLHVGRSTIAYIHCTIYKEKYFSDDYFFYIFHVIT